MSTRRISDIDGSVRSYTLTDLEEYSEFSITIEAINGAGRVTSSVLTTRTSAGGNFVGCFMEYGSTNCIFIILRYTIC